MSTNYPPEYNPAEIEKKWQNYWESNKTFKTAPLQAGQKKLYVLDMFPYPSGAGLHVGHPLGYTATDIYSRFKRMQGFKVLHPMGFDAFGLPAEPHALNTGENPAIVTEKNCGRFTEQLKQIGFSYDWDRELATCTPDYYRWTQWIFLKLYNSFFDEKLGRARPIEELEIPSEIKAQGEVAINKFQSQHRLAFYADAMVNWCPALGTVLSEEEVIDGKSERGGHDVIRKPMKQWLLRITKYADRLIEELEGVNWPESIKEQQRNWIGRKTGTEVTFSVPNSSQTITVFTTRPDTLPGVTFMVISPENPLVELFTTPAQRPHVQQYQEDAKRMSDLARTLDNRKKTGVATGGFCINPLTNEQVPVFVADYVLMSYGTGAVMGVPAHDERDFEFATTYNIPVKPVVFPKDLAAPQRDAVFKGEACYTGDGHILDFDFPTIKALNLSGKSSYEAKELVSDWLISQGLGRRVVNYKLRDWLFSRQRYWGEPIPVIHWEDGRVTALAEQELPLVLPKVADYKPSDGGESPLAKASDWLWVTDPKTGQKGRRETNIMPQWAGSCWYYLRFIDPKNSSAPWDKEQEASWMPVDLYVGGAEHAVLHLLYARFWHKVLFDLGYVTTNEPFKKLFNQGMIISHAFKDKRGAIVATDLVIEKEDGTFALKTTGEPVERIMAKMSKSLKNVVDPLDIIRAQGADTLRTYLMFMGPLEAMRPWDSKAIVGNYRFLKRSYSLIQAVASLKNGVDSQTGAKEINRVIKKVTEDLDELRFNTAIAALMQFLNEVKPEDLSVTSAMKFALLLSPFAPHLGEELWEMLGGATSLAYEAWPTFDASLLTESQATVVIQIQGKKRATVDVDVSTQEGDLKKLIIEKMANTPYAVNESAKFITVYQPGTQIPKLVNIIL